MAESRKSPTQAERDAERERQAQEKREREAAVEKRKEFGLPEDATDAQVKEAEDAATAKAVSEDRAEEEEAPRFAVEDILANARVKFGVSRHILAGALSKADQKTFTDDEVKERVKSFTSRKIGKEES